MLKNSFKFPTLTLGILFLWYLVVAIVFPITQDEAYYVAWSQVLDWGYLDHPPGVAVLTWLSRLGDLVLANGRLATVILGAASISLLAYLYQTLGLSNGRWKNALVLAQFNVATLVFGFLTTPDTGLIVCWILALVALILVQLRDERFWLLVGLAFGLGLNCKYTMVLILPACAYVFVTMNWRKPWPYAGLLVSTLLFLPHLWWNSQNHWSTVNFQLRHGFGLTQDFISVSDLPTPQLMQEDSEEAELARIFLEADRARHDQDEPTGPPPEPWRRTISRVVEFWGAQLGFWGFMLFVLLSGLLARLRGTRGSVRSEINPRSRRMLQFATWVPLMFFSCIALKSKAEANWSAMYLLAGAPLLADTLRMSLRNLTTGAILNVLVLALLVVHARTPFLPLRPERDRVLRETSGYERLARQVAQLPDPVFADSYQIVSMLMFYAPEADVEQWPDITRQSEFRYRPEFARKALIDLEEHGKFWLLTTDIIPPVLASFAARELSEIVDCGFGDLIITASTETAVYTCAPVHRWYLIGYEFSESSEE